MIWIIVVLLVWLGLTTWKDPELKKTESFKKIVNLVAGAVGGFGFSQVVQKMAVSNLERMSTSGRDYLFISALAEGAAWFCLIVAILEIFSSKEPKGL